jgi:F420-0:gamma-glutamyl ligase-like protein
MITIIKLNLMELSPNPGKNLIIEVEGRKFARYPVKTDIIKPGDDYPGIIEKYAKPYFKEGDILFIGERSLAVSQGRTFEKQNVKPGRFARFMVCFVSKQSYGIGLGSPETMQMAVEEVGVPRMLLAAFCAAVTKPFGIKGVFYMVAGPQARAVDGAADYVIPPYCNHVTKAPKDAPKVARQISDRFGVGVAIVDVCDIGGWVVGSSKGVDDQLVLKALKDNPLGQTKEQTPIGILREIK